MNLTWPTGLLPSGAVGAGLNEYHGCSSLDFSFCMGSLEERGNEDAPMVSVSVSALWVGGLGGRRTRVRVPLERGRGSEAGVGRW